MEETFGYVPKGIGDAIFVHPDDEDKFHEVLALLSTLGIRIIVDSMVEKGKFTAVGEVATRLIKQCSK